MRVALKTLGFLIGLAALLWASPAGAQTDSAGLERVLTQMDGAAKNFRSTEANVVWDQYQKVIDETETEKGKIYFRREGWRSANGCRFCRAR